MKIATGSEMRNLDQQAIETFKVPGIVLMENAGLCVFQAIQKYLNNKLVGKRILIFAGKGNNGGDGLVIARHLINAGAEVKVFLTCRADDFSGDAKINCEILKRMQVKLHTILNEKDLQKVDLSLVYADLIIDALFGTGFQGTIKGIVAGLINLLNSSGKPGIAVDVPSGVEVDTGNVQGPCFKAKMTVTFGLPKIGLYLDPAASFVGELWLGDISFPKILVDKVPINRYVITRELIVKLLPKREPSGHKGTFGHVLVIGASEGMTGAVALSGNAALRTGCGKATIAFPRSLNHIMEVKTTEVMTKPLPETDAKSLSLEALPELLNISEQVDSIVLGPGISRHDSTLSLVRDFLTKAVKPIVIDADALWAINNQEELVSKVRVPIVLTPHPGEMAHLLGKSIEGIQKARPNIALECAQKYNAVVVLKGAKTIIASPKGILYVNVTGNAGMGTAGSGDVLAGMIGSFLAQGMEPLEASVCAVYLHGLSGDFGAEAFGQRALTAGDLLTYLPMALKEMETATVDNETSLPKLRRIL
ncbi:NAD(P)H-hydrate dehydratase [Bacillota bacterium LX-D]|nr:NAD(P)H-hydrate dehydratase [Bacillota bacterium LX-D]